MESREPSPSGNPPAVVEQPKSAADRNGDDGDEDYNPIPNKSFSGRKVRSINYPEFDRMNDIYSARSWCHTSVLFVRFGFLCNFSSFVYMLFSFFILNTTDNRGY